MYMTASAVVLCTRVQVTANRLSVITSSSSEDTDTPIGASASAAGFTGNVILGTTVTTNGNLLLLTTSAPATAFRVSSMLSLP